MKAHKLNSIVSSSLGKFTKEDGKPDNPFQEIAQIEIFGAKVIKTVSKLSLG